MAVSTSAASEFSSFSAALGSRCFRLDNSNQLMMSERASSENQHAHARKGHEPGLEPKRLPPSNHRALAGFSK